MSLAVKISNGEYIHNRTGNVMRRPSKLKVAVEHLQYTGLVILPDKTSLTKAKAEILGYTIVNDSGQLVTGPADRPAYMTDAAREAEAKRYHAEITALPEAQDRPFTAEKIANAYDYRSLPVARAASILRGLPSEIVEMRERVEAKRMEREVAAENPKLQRRVELRILGLRGAVEPERRRERTALQLALATARKARISVTAALARVGIDAAQFAG